MSEERPDFLAVRSRHHLGILKSPIIKAYVRRVSPTIEKHMGSSNV
jgi:hypothetical protein